MKLTLQIPDSDYQITQGGEPVMEGTLASDANELRPYHDLPVEGVLLMYQSGPMKNERMPSSNKSALKLLTGRKF